MPSITFSLPDGDYLTPRDSMLFPSEKDANGVVNPNCSICAKPVKPYVQPPCLSNLFDSNNDGILNTNYRLPYRTYAIQLSLAGWETRPVPSGGVGDVYNTIIPIDQLNGKLVTLNFEPVYYIDGTYRIRNTACTWESRERAWLWSPTTDAGGIYPPSGWTASSTQHLNDDGTVAMTLIPMFQLDFNEFNAKPRLKFNWYGNIFGSAGGQQQFTFDEDVTTPVDHLFSGPLETDDPQPLPSYPVNRTNTFPYSKFSPIGYAMASDAAQVRK
jgi:hypothetical protein